MGNDSTNVGVGNPAVTGGAYVVQLGTTLPTDALAVLGNEVKCLGYVSEDGLVDSESQDSSDHQAWGGDTVGVSKGKRLHKFKFSPIETNPTVLQTAYGDENVTISPSGGFTVKRNGKNVPERSYIFEVIMSDTLIKRTVVPRGVIVSNRDITQNGKDLVKYDFDITALPDADGQTSYDYYAEVSE